MKLPRSSLPLKAFALRVPCALIHDRGAGKVFAVAEPAAAVHLDRLEADVRSVADSARRKRVVESVIEEDPSYRVALSGPRVARGDIYQANLSRPSASGVRPGTGYRRVYNRLCKANPAPFAALAQWRGTTILSSSPERLVRINDGHIDTRPIAGTRPRKGDDITEMRELAAHPKERAEHIMLIDLERNDLGRVSEPGTVQGGRAHDHRVIRPRPSHRVQRER